MRRKRHAFVDGIDFADELPDLPDGIRIYGSPLWLRRATSHDLTECGIAEVEVRFVRWKMKPRYSPPPKKARKPRKP